MKYYAWPKQAPLPANPCSDDLIPPIFQSFRTRGYFLLFEFHQFPLGTFGQKGNSSALKTSALLRDRRACALPFDFNGPAAKDSPEELAYRESQAPTSGERTEILATDEHR
jgi:hypothetical protein